MLDPGKPITRPPFAEFSGIAIRELMTWVGRNALWSGRLAEVLNTHVLPAAQRSDSNPKKPGINSLTTRAGA